MEVKVFAGSRLLLIKVEFHFEPLRISRVSTLLL